MQRRQGFLLFYLCAVIGALTVLAAGLPQLNFRPGRSFILNGEQAPDAAGGAAAASTADPGYLRLLLLAIVLLVLGYFVLTLIFSAKLRWQLLQRIAQVLLVLLLFYLIINRLIGTPAPLPPPQTAADTPPPIQAPTGEPLPPFIAQPAPWLVALVGLALAALLIAGIWYFWRRGRPVTNPITTLAQAAIENIQAGGDLQSVVLRCYLEMSQVLGQQRGIERGRAMTAREFAQHLAASGVRDQHIQQLTRLFEGARYGVQPPSAADERAAIACLMAIVRAYGGAA
jgi:Domain of unknown function (DUF4129)